MWTEIQIENPVFHFDGTGSIMNKIDGQKSVYLYSIALYDPKKHVIVTVADFLTTSHTSHNIHKFLSTINHVLLANMSTAKSIKQIPRYIVTDHSMALINACVQAFNQCSILQYLHYTYEIIFNNEDMASLAEKSLTTKHIICATHFLKIIIRAAKALNVSSTVRNAFVFAFTLLQNSTSIRQFHTYLIHIYNLFMSPKMNTSFLVSFNFVRNELRNRNLYNEIDLIVTSNTDEDLLREDDLIDKTLKYVSVDLNELNSIQRNSPFTTYFRKELNRYKIALQNNPTYNDVNDPVNDLYDPRLFNIIVVRLYHIPMWTGILIKTALFPDSNKIKSRLDNNPAEGYFKIVKKDELHYRKVMPSELASTLYNRLYSRYVEHYQRDKDKALQNNNTNLDFAVDKWGPKIKTLNRKSKSFYFEKLYDYGYFIENIDEQTGLLKNYNEFNDAFNQGWSFSL